MENDPANIRHNTELFISYKTINNEELNELFQLFYNKFKKSLNKTRKC